MGTHDTILPSLRGEAETVLSGVHRVMEGKQN